jgi:hypothetical protein
MNCFPTFIIIALLSLNSVHADTLEFRSREFFYLLRTTPEEINLKGYLIDLKLQKRDCNHRLIQSFQSQVNTSFQKIVIDEKDYFSVLWNNKAYKISKKSELGRFLFSVPEKVKSLKQKESFLCAKMTK